jgi:hypothetical protein
MTPEAIAALNHLFTWTVDGQHTPKNPPDALIYSIPFKNYGKTPAYAVHFLNERFFVDLYPPPIERGVFKRPIFDGLIKGLKNGRVPSSDSVMAPTQSNIYRTSNLGPIEGWSRIKEKGMSLYVMGTLVYRDVFGYERYTNFQFAHVRNRPDGSFGSTMEAYIKGNEAT